MINALRYIEILQSYGAKPSRWPQAERTAMDKFSGKFEDAKTLLAEARELDLLLDLAIAPAPSAILRASILKSANANTQKSRPAYFEIAAIAATLIAGVFIGLSNVSIFNGTPQSAPSYIASNDSALSEHDWLNETLGGSIDEPFLFEDSYIDDSFSDLFESTP